MRESLRDLRVYLLFKIRRENDFTIAVAELFEVLVHPMEKVVNINAIVYRVNEQAADLRWSFGTILQLPIIKSEVIISNSLLLALDRTCSIGFANLALAWRCWEVLLLRELWIKEHTLNVRFVLKHSKAGAFQFIHGEQVLEARLLANCVEQYLLSFRRQIEDSWRIDNGGLDRVDEDPEQRLLFDKEVEIGLCEGL